MKNKKLFELFEELKTINLTGKVGYAIAKNRRLVEQEVETLQETVKASKEFETYEKERVEIAKKHAKKDEKGKEVIENNSYILEDQEAFDKEFEVLKEAQNEVIETRKKQLEDFNDLLEEQTTLELFHITEDKIPENATAQEVYTLLKLIKE